MIAKAEALPGQGDGQPCKENSRYIVTSLDCPGRALYEDFYCARGDAENRVREIKCDLFAERSSSNLFDANAVRLCLSAFAHVLYNRLRRSLARTAVIPIGAGRGLRHIHGYLSATAAALKSVNGVYH